MSGTLFSLDSVAHPDSRDRYCPTPRHLLLLLTLLSMNEKARSKDPQELRNIPGLVILCDIGRLFMEVIEGDENRLPDDDAGAKPKGEIRFESRYSSLADILRARTDATVAFRYRIT